MAWRLSRRLCGVLGQRAWKLVSAAAATTVNATILSAIVAVERNRLIALALFFAYCFGSDIALGRCFGMMLVQKHWLGSPTVLQKLIYSSSYVICFGVLSEMEAVSTTIVGLAQITSLFCVGKTTHGLLAGMESA